MNSLEDRLQAEGFEAGCSWQDLVGSRIRERSSIAEPVQSYETRVKKKMKELEIACEVLGLTPEERLKVWKEKVPPPGDSRATMYRRLNELAKADAAGFETGDD